MLSKAEFMEIQNKKYDKAMRKAKYLEKKGQKIKAGIILWNATFVAYLLAYAYYREIVKEDSDND